MPFVSAGCSGTVPNGTRLRKVLGNNVDVDLDFDLDEDVDNDDR